VGSQRVSWWEVGRWERFIPTTTLLPDLLGWFPKDAVQPRRTEANRFDATILNDDLQPSEGPDGQEKLTSIAFGDGSIFRRGSSNLSTGSALDGGQIRGR
jgi:hypothetical protein